MVLLDNLPSKLWGLLFSNQEKGEARKWRLLGQEQNGKLPITWIHISEKSPIPVSHIGIFDNATNTLKTIYRFNRIVNTVQASVNSDETVLVFVVKEPEAGSDLEVYQPYLVEINHHEQQPYYPLENKVRSHQIMVQFLYRKHKKITGKKLTEKCIVFIHQESISIYSLELSRDSEESDVWSLNKNQFTFECIVRTFLWAQWEPVHQCLFYIHYRKPTKSLVEGEEPGINSCNMSPILSGLQFHDDLPHETVLNIPLNLPQLPHAAVKPCGIYADDVIPLRIHDCTLDLYIASDPRGVVCICHHYLYEPYEDDSQISAPNIKSVHLAYSITLLHHGCVLHCVVPGIKWNQAKQIRLTFALFGDDHMIVFVPGLFTHLLDIGTSHEPMCHILTSPCLQSSETDKQYHVVPLINFSPNTGIDLLTLDLVEINITTRDLIQTFTTCTNIDNKIAILHYLLVHKGEFDAVAELISLVAEKPLALSTSRILKEMLIGGAYMTSQRNLPAEATQLVNLLPVSTLNSISRDTEIVIGPGIKLKFNQEVLWNTAMMLLSPQQRIVPYRVDMWTRLWEQLANIDKGCTRFKTSQVSDKLMVSLVCYQPEALSRCSTPLSPGTCLVSAASTSLFDLAPFLSQSRKGDALPFHEIETCTASRQEHIISVNLRELSMHLLKQSANGNNSHSNIGGSFPNRFWQSQQNPMHVHAVATRYVAAQLEMSKLLCCLLCKAAGIQCRNDSDKGFIFIDQLSDAMKSSLFTLLERYYLAVESLAFPLPQGFNSFFAFLGYRTLPFETFMQYVKRNVFELQVDVMKIIMADSDDSRKGVLRKLSLLSLLPRSRAKRLLSQWNHPIALMIRAREHALNILSGVEGHQSRTHTLHRSRAKQLGLAAFPSADRLSPLDTFLDLLTAKASLNELDFGLLFEATITSTEEFL